MVSISLVDVPVLQFFTGRLAQTHYLYAEMQFITGKRMVEIQSNVIAIDRIDARVTGLACIIPHR